jgi:hypothetical protein
MTVIELLKAQGLDAAFSRKRINLRTKAGREFRQELEAEAGIILRAAYEISTVRYEVGYREAMLARAANALAELIKNGPAPGQKRRRKR